MLLRLNLYGQSIHTPKVDIVDNVVNSTLQLLAHQHPCTQSAAVEELFTGLDARYIEDTVDDSRSLASEIWRTFLLLMAAALLLEALLCLPSAKRTASPVLA